MHSNSLVMSEPSESQPRCLRSQLSSLGRRPVRYIRNTRAFPKKPLAVLAGFIAAVCGLIFLLPLLNRLDLRREYSWYDLGRYGIAPTQRYHSFNQSIPRVEILRQDERCSQDPIFFAPYGSVVRNPGGVIMKPDGDPIWQAPDFGSPVQDFRVQEYRGERFLTFWSGVEAGGRKQGSWYMLDSSYKVRHVISPVGGEHGDMHEFQMTKNNTALLSIYEPLQADLSAVGGPYNGYLLDGVFQEMDILTGQVLFQWRARDHVQINSTYRTIKPCSKNPNMAYNGCGTSADSAFDYFHLNSVEKDDTGNYLVSAKGVHTILYIDGGSGEILWNLGGRCNDFKDLSNGRAVDFSWQHHARFHDNGTAMSFFDNSAYVYNVPGRSSRGVLIDIDTTDRTVKLRAEYENPQGIRSFSQGNVQMLHDIGNVFVGWGVDAAFTEYSGDGELLCDARFGASAFFSFGAVMSYRAFHDTWIGRPYYPPSVAAVNGKIYASWNGATEVARWQLEGAGSETGFDSDEYDVLSVSPKTSFETQIARGVSNKFKTFRVVALGRDGERLGVSEPSTMINVWSAWKWLAMFLVFGAACVGAWVAGAVWQVMMLRRRRQREKRREWEIRLLGDQDPEAYI